MAKKDPSRAECRAALHMAMEEQWDQLKSAHQELARKELKIIELTSEVQLLRSCEHKLKIEKQLALNTNERLDNLETRLRLLKTVSDENRAMRRERLVTKEDWFLNPCLHPEEEEAIRRDEEARKHVKPKEEKKK